MDIAFIHVVILQTYKETILLRTKYIISLLMKIN